MTMVPPPPPLPHFHPENGNMQPVHKQPPSPFFVGMHIINTATHLLIGSIACVAFIFANLFVNASSFNQHIFLCVTGYVILMSQAVLTISPFSWASSFKHQDKKTIHWAMQILGSVLAIAGSILRISNVDSHFQSAHGTLGICAFIFTCLSLAGGIMNLCCTNSNFDPKLIKIGHACFGSLTIVLAFLALMFGFDKPIFRAFVVFDSNANILMSFTVLAMIGTLSPALVNIVQRLSN